MYKLTAFHDHYLVVDKPEVIDGKVYPTSRFINPDLVPIEPQRRKWEWYHIGGFWLADGFAVSNMQVPQAAVTLGMNPGYAVLACFVGNTLSIIPCCINGFVGAKYGLNFPVIIRSSFGMYGSYMAVVIRGVICVIWYGIQAFLGGSAVQVCLEAIWPSFQTWHLDSLPASAELTAPQLLCFMIFWLLSLPILFIPMPLLRWAFLAKIIVMPIFGIVLFTWALTAGNGFGELFAMPNNITTGTTLGFVFCTTITSTVNSTFAINMPDFTRYARNARSTVIAQAIMGPIVLTLIQLLGAVMASASLVIYGTVEWNPLVICGQFNDRTAKFFAGFLFAFATMMTNVAGNSVAFGNDITSLFPKYMTIRRGQIVCAILGFAITPWNIESKATTFLAFLSGYNVFLGPICGIMMSDYWLCRRGRGFKMNDLYNPHGGNYWFFRGWNYRALVAFFVPVATTFPGLLHGMGVNISQGILNYYTMNWVDGVVISALLYWLLFFVSPFPIDADAEIPYVDGLEIGSTDRTEYSLGKADNGVTLAPV